MHSQRVTAPPPPRAPCTHHLARAGPADLAPLRPLGLDLCHVCKQAPVRRRAEQPSALGTRWPRARIDAHLTRAGDCPLHVVADVDSVADADSVACAQTTTALLARTCTADVRIVVPRCVPLGDADWSPACQKLCQAAAALCEQSGTGGLSVRAPLRGGTSASVLVHLELSYIPLRAPVPPISALRHLGLESVKAPAEDGWIDQWLATMPRLAQLRLKDVTVGADVPPFREREHVTLRQFHIHNSADGRWLQRWLAAAPSSGRSTWM
jgi:hypothetical protein